MNSIAGLREVKVPVEGLMLSVICPAHTDRYSWPIIHQLKEQMDKANCNGPVVEFLCLADNGPLSTGYKLNMLYALTQGLYVSAIGDDDILAPDYVERILRGIHDNPGVDVISFDHSYYVNGGFNALTKVSKDFSLFQEGEVHHRKPTPKCAIRAEICKEFVCPEISDREDIAMTEWLDGKLSSEVRIEGTVIYTHDWKTSNKAWRKEQSRRWRRK